VSRQEVAEWQALHEPNLDDSKSATALRRARYNIYNERQGNFLKTAGVEKKKGALNERSASQVNVLSARVANSVATSQAATQAKRVNSILKARILEDEPLSDSQVDDIDLPELENQILNPSLLILNPGNLEEENPFNDYQIDDVDLLELDLQIFNTPAAIEVPNATAIHLIECNARDGTRTNDVIGEIDELVFNSSYTIIDTSVIDPRLLGEDDAVDDARIDSVELGALEDQILPTESSSRDEPNGDQIIEMTQVLLADTDHAEITADMSGAVEFITRYSKLNVIKSEPFAWAWPHYLNGVPFEDSIAKYAEYGNSRDPLTAFVLYCTKTPGCSYRAYRKQLIIDHEVICNEEFVARAVLRTEVRASVPCSQEDYPKSFRTRGLMLRHV
jgi:hypothetical protein